MSYFTEINGVKGNRKSVKASQILERGQRDFKKDRENIISAKKHKCENDEG